MNRIKNFVRKIFPTKKFKTYQKMHKRHKKELVKYVQEIHEWHWGWLHDSIGMQLRHMLEFYKENNNVWQVDESRLEIIKQLEKALELFANANEIESTSLNDEEVQKAIIEFYSYLGEHIREWWD